MVSVKLSTPEYRAILLGLASMWTRGIHTPAARRVKAHILTLCER